MWIAADATVPPPADCLQRGRDEIARRREDHRAVHQLGRLVRRVAGVADPVGAHASGELAVFFAAGDDEDAVAPVLRDL